MPGRHVKYRRNLTFLFAALHSLAMAPASRCALRCTSSEIYVRRASAFARDPPAKCRRDSAILTWIYALPRALPRLQVARPTGSGTLSTSTSTASSRSAVEVRDVRWRVSEAPLVNHLPGPATLSRAQMAPQPPSPWSPARRWTPSTASSSSSGVRRRAWAVTTRREERVLRIGRLHKPPFLRPLDRCRLLRRLRDAQYPRLQRAAGQHHLSRRRHGVGARGLACAAPSALTAGAEGRGTVSAAGALCGFG
jgi:hypothetical protein